MKFDILVCDAPWSYDRKSTGGTNKSGSVQKYDTMTRRELHELEEYIIPLMNKDSVIFLWTTVPMLEDAIELLGFWAFRYITMVTWIKKNYGLGNYFRGKTEHLLVGIRGKVKPFRLQSPNLIISENTLKHSEKPEQSYTLIESCAIKMGFNTNSRINILELFARQKKKYNFYENARWTCIGKEITGNDIVTDLKALGEKV